MENVNPLMMPGAVADEFDLDLSDVTNYFIIPDGDYKVVCVDVEQSVSQAGNPQFVWTFSIEDGKYKGKEFKQFTALTPAAMWKVAETVTALGVGAAGERVKFTRATVVGKKCIATIEETEYKGKVNSSIIKVSPVA